MKDLAITGNSPDTSTNTRLKGGWLWPVRLIWFFLLILCVSLYLAAIPLHFEELRTTCYQAPCLPGQIGEEAVAVLESIGLSLDFHATSFFILQILIMVFYIPAALLIFWRRSDDWMAILVSVTLILLGVGSHPLILALGRARPVLEPLTSALSLIQGLLFITLLYLFPNGRFEPRWSRWLLLTTILVLVIAAASTQVFWNPERLLLYLACTGGGVTAQIYRYRRISGPTERQQTKWVVFGVALSLVGPLLMIPIFLGFPPLREAASLEITASPAHLLWLPLAAILVFPVTYAMPVFIVFSVLRYRIWDVDPILNRSVVYGSLTLFLGLIFAGGFFVLRGLLGMILGSGQPAIALVISTAIVVGLFNPTRRALRRFVDRRFYGIEIEYASPGRRMRPATEGSLTHIGSYTDLEPLGSGGMAEVYRSIHPSLNVPVAVKVLPHKLAQKEEFRRRFEREAQVVADLTHPNIVQMHDFGVEDGTSYMVMEYIEGIDLSQMIETRGQIQLSEVQPILQQIAAALDYAHQQGLVHRDIKPSNVMVDGSGRAVLMDFGIARIQTAMTQLTGTGGMVGTLDYIAPEQIHGASDVDGRADVYSLGVMAYQMLTGELPFKKANPGALVMAHLMEPPPDVRDSVPGLPEGVAEAIIRAMAKRPGERFNTAGKMMMTLAQ